jgi:hypothetical protein
MSTFGIVAAIVAIGALLVVFIPVIRLYRRYSGKRVITCPENHRSAAVEADALQAAFSGRDQTNLRLKDCSRWPEKENCGQECISQIEKSPEDCLLRSIFIRWYHDKSCTICGKPFGKIDWTEHKPAIIGPDGKTMAWAEVVPDQVHEVLDSHLPICWDCHIASAFRREHPDLVVDRNFHRPGNPGA